MTAGAFAKIAQASATGGGNNIRDGVYKLLIEAVKLQEGHTGTSFIAEFRVITSESNGALDERGNQVKPNSPGSSCSMVCNLTKHESAAGNAKAFVQAALAGLGIGEVTPEMMAHVCSSENPLRGVAIVDETYRGVNKGRANAANMGKPLTLNKWKPIAQTEEEILAQRAFLDSNSAKVDANAAAPSVGSTVQQAAAAQASAPAETQATTPAPTPTPAKSAVLGGILGNLGKKS